MKAGFIGAGRWALTLALKLYAKGIKVALYEPAEAARNRLLTTRRHPDLPESAVLPAPVNVSSEPEPVLKDAEILIFATPAVALARAAATIKPLIPESCRLLVSVTKGIEPNTHKRLSLVLRETFPGMPVVVLAGPGIPYDVANNDPTSLVAVSEDEAAARLIRDTFTTGTLRVYSHTDVVGVEIAAAFKNVIAIAAGIADGIGLGINAKSALLTRGLAEITRLGLALNANPLTFAGLAGMGDLIVTAFSPYSRNHRLGIAIGTGIEPSSALAGLNGVAEGYWTARAGLELSRRLRVEMPITEEVYRLLYQGEKPANSIERLLRRPTKKEFY
ncbi:MAG: NAD(P)H-dependent glycerol-3-phosphate dehydrogenase [candidate division WOR-3 bacterium]|jgi:glycerol-3-phosphate dehydrogenase (NAD(P)+)